MAYVTSNPPRLLAGDLTNTGPNIWSYASADAVATVRVINYFTNALDLGMKKNDVVLVSVTGGTATVSWCLVMAVIAAGADLSDGLVITATNSD